MNEITEEIKRINKLMNESTVDEGMLNKIIDIVSKVLDKEISSSLRDEIKNLLSAQEVSGEVIPAGVEQIMTNDDDFYDDVLDCLGAPKTYSNKLFFYAWRQSEGGSAKNNPFNTTYKKGLDQDDYTNYNSAGVKNYSSKFVGVEATCKTLKLSYYNDIVDALKSGDAFEKIDTMKSLKTWGTGDLLKKVADGYAEGSTPKPPPIA